MNESSPIRGCERTRTSSTIVTATEPTRAPVGAGGMGGVEDGMAVGGTGVTVGWTCAVDALDAIGCVAGPDVGEADAELHAETRTTALSRTMAGRCDKVGIVGPSETRPR